MSHAIDFFDRQFRRQAAAHEFALNPFERLALDHVRGEVLDLGCGLGNFALAAARRGCRVHALDASPAAIESLRERSAAESLTVDAAQADAAAYVPDRPFDAVVSIGLLMFFSCDVAERLLARLQAAVRPGGVLVINVLVRGTTYLDMFDRDACCLFEPARLDALLADWDVVASEDARFPAPGGTVKVFRTMIASRPAADV